MHEKFNAASQLPATSVMATTLLATPGTFADRSFNTAAAGDGINREAPNKLQMQMTIQSRQAASNMLTANTAGRQC